LMATNKFHHHRTTSYDFGCHWWIRSIFGHHLGTIKWRLNYCSIIQCQPIFKKVFEGMWILKCNFWFIFEHLFFSFGFCVFGCPFTTIVWNPRWVEVIKSLVKGNHFHILQNFWNTLNLDFSKL
jgi:hypothetical protein